MKKIYSIKYIVLFLAIFLSISNLKAQESKYSVALDTNMIVIGDQINFTIKAIVPKDVKIEFPILKDTLVKGIEILSVGQVKSKPLDNNLKEELIEYKITAFDTGVYLIPSLALKIQNKGFDNIVRTESLQLGVNTFEVDKEKGYTDIFAPREAPMNFAELLPYLLWILLALVLLALSIYLYKKWKNKESLFAHAPKPQEPAHIIAYRNLDRIKKEKLWENNKVKEFHTQVSDTLRSYIEQEFSISAMEQTSIEILEGLKQETLFDKRLVDKMEEVLSRADFVKFAKFIPLSNENQQSLDYAYEIVNIAHKAVADKLEKENSKGDENIDD